MRSTLLIFTCLACGAAIADDEKPIREARAPANTLSSPIGAELKPTQGNSVTGSLKLIAEQDGVRVSGLVKGLKPGTQQGFHVHEKGDCSAPDASSAGDHFNPTAKPHGNPKDHGAHHVGDMVNLKVDDKGIAKVDTLIAGATLQSGKPTDVTGKAIVVHQKPDDYTSQPSGDSGDRAACGVIK